MKKRILSTILLSGIVLNYLSQGVAVVNASDFDNQIVAKESVISNLTKEQAIAKKQVLEVQEQVSSLESQQKALNIENSKLQEESKALSEEITVLAEKIVSRSASLENQARSAQKNNTAISYINTLVSSDSLSDAINRVVAIREVVSANERMLSQQEADKKAIEEKQKANQEAINKVWENQAVLQDTSIQLTTQKASLEVAELNLAAELATVESEKIALLESKAQAEVVAKAAAEAEAIAREKARAEAEAQKESIAAAQPLIIAKPTVSSEPAVVPVESAVVSPIAVAKENSYVEAITPIEQPVAPSPVSTATTSTAVIADVPSVSSSNNTYPIGQCTWGVKSLAPWVGNYWGNANQWGVSAQAAGFSIGNVPVPGAVAVWMSGGGGYGHVAYVTAVESSDKIQVLESNFNGNMSINNYRGWFNPHDPIYGGGAVYYIYP